MIKGLDCDKNPFKCCISKPFDCLKHIFFYLIVLVPPLSSPFLSAQMVFVGDDALQYSGIGNISTTSQSFDIHAEEGKIAFATGVGAVILEYSWQDSLWHISKVLESKINGKLLEGSSISFWGDTGLVLGTNSGYVFVWPNKDVPDRVYKFKVNKGNPARILSVFPTNPYGILVFTEENGVERWVWNETVHNFVKQSGFYTKSRIYGISSDWARSAQMMAFAFGGDTSTVYVWDLNGGEFRYGFINTSPELEAIAISPDGQWLACGEASGRLTLYRIIESDTVTYLILKKIKEAYFGRSRITSLNFSQDDKYLLVASGSFQSRIHLVKVPSLRKIALAYGFIGPIYKVQFWQDRTDYAVAVGDDGSFKFLQINPLAKKIQFFKTTPFFTNDITALSFGSNDSSLLVATSVGEVQLWKIDFTGKYRPVSSIEKLREEFITAFDKDVLHKELSGGTSGGSILKFREREGTFFGRKYPKYNFFIKTIKYSKSKIFLGVGGYEGNLYILKAGDFSEYKKFDLGDAAILSMDFSLQDDFVVAGTEDSLLVKVNILNGDVQKLKLDGKVDAVAVSPLDNTIFAGTSSGTLYVFRSPDSSGYKSSLSLSFAGPITSLEIADDGKWLFVATDHKIFACRLNWQAQFEHMPTQAYPVVVIDSIKFNEPIRDMDLSSSKLVVGTYPGIVHTVRVEFPSEYFEIPENESEISYNFPNPPNNPRAPQGAFVKTEEPTNNDEVLVAEHYQENMALPNKKTTVIQEQQSQTATTSPVPSPSYPNEAVTTSVDPDINNYFGIEITEPIELTKSSVVRIRDEGSLLVKGVIYTKDELISLNAFIIPIIFPERYKKISVPVSSSDLVWRYTKGNSASDGKKIYQFQIPIIPQDNGIYTVVITSLDESRTRLEKSFILLKGLSSNLFAIIIGVDGSRNDMRITPTDFALSEAYEVKDFLSDLNIPEQNIVLLTEDEASSQNIEKNLKAMATRISQFSDNCYVLIFYIGQAFYDPHYSDIYFLTNDTRLDALTTTGLSMKNVLDLFSLDEYPNLHLFVIIDAVNQTAAENMKKIYANTSLNNSNIAFELNKRIRRLLNKASVYQGSEYQLSALVSTMGKDLSNLSLSGQTTLFLEGVKMALLGKGDANGDGLITFNELAEFVKDYVENASQNRQHVFLIRGEYGDFPMAIVTRNWKFIGKRSNFW